MLTVVTSYLRARSLSTGPRLFFCKARRRKNISCFLSWIYFRASIFFVALLQYSLQEGVYFMKKLGFLALLLTVSFGLFAEVKESELYYVRVRVVRAFTHQKGYYVIYSTPNMGLAEAFIPYSWFKPGDKRAVLTNTTDRIDPYLSLYTKNGEFDHIKVALPLTSPKSSVWGWLRTPAEYDSKFDVETIEFQY